MYFLKFHIQNAEKSPEPNAETMLVDMHTAMILNDTDVIVDMAERGLGVGRVLEPLVAQKFEQGTLIPVMQDYWVEVAPLYLYYDKTAINSPRDKSFVDYVVGNVVV